MGGHVDHAAGSRLLPHFRPNVVVIWGPTAMTPCASETPGGQMRHRKAVAYPDTDDLIWEVNDGTTAGGGKHTRLV